MTSRQLLVGGLFAALLVLGSAVTVSAAEQRALGAETDHVEARLANATCLEDWGANEGAADGYVSVVGVTPGGVRIAVGVPYAYRVDADGGPVFADAVSEAVYEVTPSGSRRVGGDELDPC